MKLVVEKIKKEKRNGMRIRKWSTWMEGKTTACLWWKH
jgi:hypothetical protein